MPLVVAIAAEGGVRTKVAHICSLVPSAALVEIRITAFYESARIHNKQSIQRRRFLVDLWISVIFRRNPY